MEKCDVVLAIVCEGREVLNYYSEVLNYTCISECDYQCIFKIVQDIQQSLS